MKRIILSFFLVFSVFCINSLGQNATLNKYGLKVIDNLEVYKEIVKNDSSQSLIDLKKFIPSIKLDIRYATKNNFLGEPVYKQKRAFARYPAAIALKAVQAELKEKGLGLMIYDGYRPYTVTCKFFEKTKDTVFCAVPWRGSRHNRGCAIDLTLYSLKTGKALPMPTPFDDFSKKAHAEYKDLPANIIKNRETLKEVMAKHGFKVLADEWWHYDYTDWNKFDLMDIPFENL